MLATKPGHMTPYGADRTAVAEDDVLDFRKYPDDGCAEVSDSCLACPLPQCRWDDPVAFQAEQRRKKDLEVETAWNAKPRMRSIDRAKKVAEELGIRERTVYRALRRLSLYASSATAGSGAKTPGTSGST